MHDCIDGFVKVETLRTRGVPQHGWNTITTVILAYRGSPDAFGKSVRDAFRRTVPSAELLSLDQAGTRTDLDLVLALDGSGADLQLPSSRLGTWSFRWDGASSRAAAGVAALAAGRRDSSVELTGPQGVLEGARIKTIAHSLARTQERLLAAGAILPAHALARIAAGSAGSLATMSPANPPPADRISRLAQFRNLGQRIIRESWEEQWLVGILDQTPDEIMTGVDHRKVRWLVPRPGGYHADPFGLTDGSGHPLILAEAYDFAERLGYLVAVKPDGTERTILREPFHLSYPQIVEHEGRRWLLPEAKAAGCVRLYEPDPWPDGFRRGPVLIEGLAAADPTLHHDEQGFWLFAGDGNAQDETTLVLYHAPDLLGPWRPHPMNPIKIDLGSARPAGPLFRADGRLWRPAQDCSTTYGGAIVLNEVLILTPDLYVERPSIRLNPDPAGPCPHGIHTLTPFGRGFLIDGKREFRSLKRWIVGLRGLAGA